MSFQTYEASLQWNNALFLSHINFSSIAKAEYGPGDEGAAVLLPGFAIIRVML